MAVDQSGKEYYYKENSQESLWELPEVSLGSQLHSVIILTSCSAYAKIMHSNEAVKPLVAPLLATLAAFEYHKLGIGFYIEADLRVCTQSTLSLKESFLLI